MENNLLISSITKQEFISILEGVIETKLSKIQESDLPENYTVQSAAEIIEVTKLSIYNYIKKGIIPAKRIGRKYVIKRSDLDAALKDVKSLKYKRHE